MNTEETVCVGVGVDGACVLLTSVLLGVCAFLTVALLELLGACVYSAGV